MCGPTISTLNPSACFHQACADYRDLVQTHGRKWQRMFQHEREQRSNHGESECDSLGHVSSSRPFRR